MFRKQLQPLSDGDKTVLVLSFLEERGEVELEGYKDLPINEVEDFVLGTPHYTLINALEMFYLYRRNTQFRTHINNLAAQFGISLNGLPLNPKFIIRLGFTFISTRPNLTEEDKKSISESWSKKYKNVDKEFSSEEEACDSWVHDIIQGLQINEGLQPSAPALGGIVDNDLLKDRYLEYRQIS